LDGVKGIVRADAHHDHGEDGDQKHTHV
jgi:hypothetical protein